MQLREVPQLAQEEHMCYPQDQSELLQVSSFYASAQAVP
jgi:hypothetical protein